MHLWYTKLIDHASIEGRNQLAWVKIGLSIRFGQTLQLSQEPENQLPFYEREERRCTFWSVYLLDKLVSCSRNHPPTIMDSDCDLHLPLEDISQLSQPLVAQVVPTLATLCDIPTSTLLAETDHFALVIFMASVLGRIVRLVFQQRSTETYFPWDSRSEFSRIYGILLSFETYSSGTGSFESFETALCSEFGTQSKIDFSRGCHFIYSHLLYHVNYCLLYHPFLLRERLKTCNVRVPLEFMSTAVERSKYHAVLISKILGLFGKHNCEATPSFFGYGAIVAAVVHYLHATAANSTSSEQSKDHFADCMSFLECESTHWDNHQRMVRYLSLRNL
jgi:hypothetical protein